MLTEKNTVRNSTIDLFRYLCAVMIIAIHTHPFSEMNTALGYIFTQILPRIAVPFFFCAAGYFYIGKLIHGQTPFFSYLKRLVMTYAIWSLLYFLLDFCTAGYKDPKAFLLTCVYRFFLTGSHYHFWFFPALIFAVCLTTLIYRIGGKKLLLPLGFILYAIGCLGCSYHSVGIRIPLLCALYESAYFEVIRRVLCMGFPFFVCGYLVHRIKDRQKHEWKQGRLLCALGVTVVIWLLEIILVRALALQENIILTFGLYPLVVLTMLVLLRNPLPAYAPLAKKARVLANFTYYAHPLCIAALNVCASSLLHINMTETPLFLLTTALTLFGGLLLYRWDNKYLNLLVR